MLLLYQFIDLLLTVLYIAVIARALFTWFDPGLRSTLGRLLHDITEPIIGPIRSVLPRTGMIDFSPIVAIVLIIVLQRLVRGIFF